MLGKFKFFCILILACMLLPACGQGNRKHAVSPSEKATLALSATIEAALAQIAHEKGFFQDEGLDVTVRMHPYGKLSLDDLLEGNADFATAGEAPIMFAIMNGKKVSVLAMIQSSQRDNAIVARKDRGIHSVKDLKGKRIATAFGTTSDYFLRGVLTLHGIAVSEVEVVDIPADQMPGSLFKGEVDAIAVFSTYAFPSRKKLADKGIVFMEDTIQTSSYQLTAAHDVVRDNPKKVEKLLRALVRAEEYAQTHPETAQQIVADFTQLDPDHIKEAWADRRFKVTLDQGLILALEDESRWAIRNKLCLQTAIPNYLGYIYLDGLRAVRPHAVKILK